MALDFSFNRRGATPRDPFRNVPSAGMSPVPGQSRTRPGRAIGNIASGIATALTPAGLSPLLRLRPRTSGMLRPTSQAPLKEETRTNTDGSSTTFRYQPRSDSSSSSTQNSFSSGQSSTPPAPTPPTNTQTQPPAPTGMQVGNQQQNAQNVLDVSGRNALAEGASSAEALYGMLGSQRQLQPFAGGQTQALDQTYANLTRPQSTANLAGQSGLFDVQRGILQEAANRRTQQALESQRIGQTGATSVLQAGQIYPTAQGQAEFSGLRGYEDGGGYFGSPTDPQTAVNRQVFNDLGAQTGQLQAELNGLTANTNLLSNTISKAGTNEMNIPWANALNQMVQRGVASPADLAAFQAMVAQLQQQGVTITPNLSLDAIKRELEGQIALRQNTIVGNQNRMAQLRQGSSGSSSGGSQGGGGFATAW